MSTTKSIIRLIFALGIVVVVMWGLRTNSLSLVMPTWYLVFGDLLFASLAIVAIVNAWNDRLLNTVVTLLSVGIVGPVALAVAVGGDTGHMQQLPGTWRHIFAATILCTPVFLLFDSVYHKKISNSK